jgi:hypothetical protein
VNSLAGLGAAESLHAQIERAVKGVAVAAVAHPKLDGLI